MVIKVLIKMLRIRFKVAWAPRGRLSHSLIFNWLLPSQTDRSKFIDLIIGAVRKQARSPPPQRWSKHQARQRNKGVVSGTLGSVLSKTLISTAPMMRSMIQSISIGLFATVVANWKSMIVITVHAGPRPLWIGIGAFWSALLSPFPLSKSTPTVFNAQKWKKVAL